MARNKKNDSFKISSKRNVPDPLAPWEEKIGYDYGLRYGKLIEHEWFYVQSGNTYNAYQDKRIKFDELRKYARGEHSTGLAKKLITDGTDGESYTNYDWRPIQVLPKFIKLVVNQMLERLYEIDAQAVDGVSQGLREDYKKILEKNMVAKQMLEDAKEKLGIDLFPTGIGEIPQTQEEIDLQMSLNYKPAIEVAIEQALKYTLEYNEYDEIQKQLLKDLVEVGVGCLFHRTDPVKGIVVERLDAADMVWSYPTQSNFGNVYYYGHVKRMTIGELQALAGDEIDDYEALRNVSNEWQGYNRISDQFWYRGEDLASHMVDVLTFSYKTNKVRKFKKKFKKNGGYSIIEKPSDFKKTEDQIAKEEAQGYMDFEVLTDIREVWMEGNIILGSDKIFGYKEVTDLVRPEGFIDTKVESNYILYAPELYQGRIQSLVERVMPDIDQMQQIKVKIQQFIAKAKPNGIYIDIDGLEEVDLGDGNTLSPLELIRFYDDTGNLIGTSRMMDGRMNFSGGVPIKELNNGGIAGLEQLIGAYNTYMQMFREAIGIGQGADGSLPHPDTSVGALNQNVITSNVSTRYVLDSQLKMTQYLANCLALRLKSVFRFSNLRDAYINSIGQNNIEVLESMESLHLHDFGITIKLKPDREERAMLEANIQKEIDKGGISTTDAIDIRRVSNLYLANEMLKLKIKKREELAHQREMEKIKANGDASARASQEQAAAKKQEIQIETQSKLQLLEAEKQKRYEEIQWEVAAKERLMATEHKYKTGQQIQVEKAKQQNMKYAEDRKDKRTAIQATQQSKMKEQQKKEKAEPIDFESEHATMTGDFGLDDFRT